MSPRIRWTLGTALVWGLAFGGVAVYRSLAMGANPLSHVALILAFATIGATVGGLIGPLVLGLVERRRAR